MKIFFSLGVLVVILFTAHSVDGGSGTFMEFESEAAQTNYEIGDSGANTECPEGTEQMKKLVGNFLFSYVHAEYRQQFGIEGVTHKDQIEILTDPEDTEVCTWLNENVRFPEQGLNYTWRRAYYKAGDFYFAIADRELAPGQWVLGHSPLIVFDGDLNPLQAFAM